MRRRLMGWTAAVALIVTGFAARLDARQESDRRPTLAVVEFEAAPGGWTLPPRDLGTSLSQLMLDRLVTSGQYHVLDAQWVTHGIRDRDALLEAIRASGVEKPIDYVVLGSVIRFSNESRQQHGGMLLPLAATVATRGLALPLLAGFHHNRSELVVAVTVRVVNVRTGEVITTAVGQGSASRKKMGLGGLGGGSRLGGGGYGTAASDFRDAVVAEAATEAIAMAAQQLLAAAPKLAVPHEDTARRP
jgi:curli biogenesis system outer membrane secretion channel CsgG